MFSSSRQKKIHSLQPPGVVGNSIGGSVQSKSGKSKPDIMEQWAIPLVGGSWIFFVGYELFIGFDHMHSAHPFCASNVRDFGTWPHLSLILVICLGCYATLWILLFLKITLMRHTKSVVPLIVALNIITMGIITTCLSYFLDWGGVCIDVLNVASLGCLWGEWMGSAPLLIFITITLVDKPHITWLDWFLIITFFLCLVAGWLIIATDSVPLGQFWLIASFVTYIPSLYLPFYDRHSPIHLKKFDNEDIFSINFSNIAERYALRRNMSTTLTLVLPLIPLCYLLGMWNIFDYATTLLVYQVVSVASKGTLPRQITRITPKL